MTRIAIAGAGISGLCTAHFLVRHLSAAGRGAEILILEAESAPGGKMRTIRDRGFRLEWGPNGFLTNKPHTLELVKELRIENRLAPSSDLARKRFIFSGGMLHRLPESPPAFFRSRLLSLPGRLRILGEPFAPGPPAGVDESLGDFARRRLGSEALEKLLDPMVTGIYAGDPDKMSVRSCFPLVCDLERKYGGLIKGMIALQRERRKAGEKREMSAGPGGILVSFDEGVETLIAVLSDRLAEGLHTGVSVQSITRRGEAFTLSLVEGGRRSELDADVVVMAIPAFAAASALSSLDPGFPEALQAIPYSPISVVALGYDRAAVGNPLDGFGFLVPRGERRRILGALWDSSVFPNRAPEGKALIRAMIGGVRNPDLAALPDEEIVALTREELAATMGVTGNPLLVRVFRHDRGIPQYLVGHEKRLRAIEEILSRWPGLYLNSNAYRGIALNDCVLQSRLTAERLAKDLGVLPAGR